MAQLKDLIVNGPSTFIGAINGDLAGNADTATKATQDASGNVITNTYALKTNGIYSVIGTQTESTNEWTGNINVSALYDGLTIAYFLPWAGTSDSATLNLTLANGTTTGAKDVYYTGTTRATTHYAKGSTIILTYWSAGSISIDGTATTNDRWTRADYKNDNTVPSAISSTQASTAAKVASCTYWALTANSYIHVVFRYANTKNAALTLSINGTTAKPIYINGTASSSTNYTLPAGSYIAYYDGTAYQLRTDGYLPGPGVKSIVDRVATLEGIASSALVFKGVAATAFAILELTNYKVGWCYKASANFTITGIGPIESGDMIICVHDYVIAFNSSDWTVVQNNVDVYQGATSSESGIKGLVPSATSSQRDYIFRGDGTWTNEYVKNLIFTDQNLDGNVSISFST